MSLCPGRPRIGSIAIRRGRLGRWCHPSRDPAARLGEAAGDEVRPAENRDVQPGLAGDELVGSVVAAVDQRGADQNRDDQTNHRPKLGGLERGLGLCGEPAETGSDGNIVGFAPVGRGTSGGHESSLDGNRFPSYWLRP